MLKLATATVQRFRIISWSESLESSKSAESLYYTSANVDCRSAAILWKDDQESINQGVKNFNWYFIKLFFMFLSSWWGSKCSQCYEYPLLYLLWIFSLAMTAIWEAFNKTITNVIPGERFRKHDLIKFSAELKHISSSHLSMGSANKSANH